MSFFKLFGKDGPPKKITLKYDISFVEDKGRIYFSLKYGFSLRTENEI